MERSLDKWSKGTNTCASARSLWSALRDPRWEIRH